MRRKTIGAAARSTSRPWCRNSDLVAEAPRLRRGCASIITIVVPARVDRRDDRLDLARRAGIEARRRLVEKQHVGLQRPRAREREALLLAAGQHARRAVARVARGRRSRAPRRARRRARAAANARERERIARRWPAPSGAAAPAAGTPSPAGGGRRRRSAPRRSRPTWARASPCSRRSSMLLPAPLAPRMTVRGPALDRQRRSRVDDRACRRERRARATRDRQRACGQRISRSAAARAALTDVAPPR